MLKYRYASSLCFALSRVQTDEILIPNIIFTLMKFPVTHHWIIFLLIIYNFFTAAFIQSVLITLYMVSFAFK